MKFAIFIILLLTSCASASPASESERPEPERTPPANTEAQFEEDMTMVCETSPDVELKAEDFIALWKDQAQTQKMKALIGDDRESVVWLRDRLDAERGNTCAILAHWDPIFSGGKIYARDISAVFRSSSDEFEACYKRVLKDEDYRQFKVVMTVTITPDGTTKNVSGRQFVLVDGEFIESDKTLAVCLGQVIEQLQFPKPEGEDLTVRKTLVFETS